MLVLGELHIERAAEITDRKQGYLRNLTDPAKREVLCVRDLELLDLAHHARFGRGFPLFEALGRRMATARAERFADSATIGRHGAALARENGEAITALLEAAIVGDDQLLIREALKQTEDVVREGTATIASLRTVIDRHGEPGGPMPP